MRQSNNEKLLNTSIWNEEKLKRIGVSMNYKDNLTTTVFAYLNGPTQSTPSGVKNLKYRKSSKASKGIDKCIKKLSKQAEDGLTESQKLIEKSRPSTTQVMDSRAMSRESNPTTMKLESNKPTSNIETYPDSIMETGDTEEAQKQQLTVETIRTE